MDPQDRNPNGETATAPPEVGAAAGHETARLEPDGSLLLGGLHTQLSAHSHPDAIGQQFVEALEAASRSRTRSPGCRRTCRKRSSRWPAAGGARWRSPSTSRSCTSAAAAA